MRLFAHLAHVNGVRFFSLQKGAPAAQARTPPQEMRLLDYTEDLRDFADTAALVSNLDLVVTVDTSVAHLAGGLGIPTWMLSRYNGCWRWLLDREDSPWYPSMRIFRQTRAGDWQEVIERVAAALAERAQHKLSGGAFPNRGSADPPRARGHVRSRMTPSN